MSNQIKLNILMVSTVCEVTLPDFENDELCASCQGAQKMTNQVGLAL